MFSLSKDGERARPIATINTGKYKKDVIYLERPVERDPARMEVDVGKDRLFPHYNKDGREITFVTAQSGAGKSTFAGKFAMTFKKANPKKDIYIFSRKDASEDPAYKKLKPIQIKLDRSMVENPIQLSDFQEGSMVIFDDVGTIKDKEIEAEVEHIIMELMEVARFKGIHVIITTHVVTKNTPLYQLLKVELHNFVFFPSSGVGKPLKRFLENQFCLNTKEIRKVLKKNKDEDYNWIMLQRNVPQIIMNPHGIEILSHFIDDDGE